MSTLLELAERIERYEILEARKCYDDTREYGRLRDPAVILAGLQLAAAIRARAATEQVPA